MALDEQVSPFDALMVAGEDDPRTRSAFVGAFLLARPPQWSRLVASFERASRLTLRLRQRVVFPSLPVGAPRWVVDPDFDLGYHLRRACLPAPGGHSELLEWMAPLLMSPLDRARPLWEAYLVEGLEGGRGAVVMKFNHALFDGLGSVRAMANLFDLEADPPARPLPHPPVPSDVLPADLVQADLMHLPLALAGAAAATVRGAVSAAARPRRSLAGLGCALSRARLAAEALGPAPVPRSPLLGERSPSRRLFTTEVGVDDLKRAAKTVGGSLNDAYLAAVVGAVARYHRQLGVDLDAFPLALPISLRTAGDPDASNRWTGARIAAPAAERDPRRRMAAIADLVREARRKAAVDALSPLLPVAARLPRPLVAGLAARATATDVQASNVPGWDIPIYLAGAEVLACFPFGPLPGVAMMVVLMSACGTCYVGVNYDPAAVREAAMMVQALEDAFAEVVAVGQERSARSVRAGAGVDR